MRVQNMIKTRVRKINDGDQKPRTAAKAPKIICKISPDYTGRVTRSLQKILDYISNFIIIEAYRCMPLLGDEELVPNWEVHIVHYTVVFTKKSSFKKN